MKPAAELQVLYDISRILDETDDLKSILTPILLAISSHTPMVRGAITLLNRNTKEILIESAYGLTDIQQQKGRYRIGEGITGIVVESGHHLVIPDISKDSRYMNKTGAETDLIKERHRISFFSIPIHSGHEIIGTLNISFMD
ncbi:MAG: GAF domain-containing protein, partial [Sphaerochaetaceae bacterium]|nr:GAF domain-containing protein [Sphaerochaetaceae bacterium]